MLAEGAHNAILSESLQILHARVAVFRRYAFVDPERIEPSIAELEAIIQAAAVDCDSEAAWMACEHQMLVAGELVSITSELARCGLKKDLP